MMKYILIAIMVFGFGASATHAMTLKDVMQQYDIYKKAPKVLGATSDVPVPTPKDVTISKDQGVVLIKGLKFTAGSAAIVSKEMKTGEKDSDSVKKLQLFLISKGHLQADPTGTYGAMTRKAVQAYQKEKGLPTSGTVGPKTLKAIEQDVDAVAATQ